MGKMISQFYMDGHKPDYIPDSNSTPTYPPDFGFEAPRKKRVSKYTPEEIKAMKLPAFDSGYCADNSIQYLMCLRKNLPFKIMCKSELHALKECQFQDEVLRMKEFEREKRLRIRELKLQGKTVA